jgi:hypothetical protein
MKISVVLGVFSVLLVLTACENEKPRSAPVVASNSPSSTSTVGPISQDMPKPSMMPSATASSSSSKFSSPTANSLNNSNVVPSSLAASSAAVGAKSSPGSTAVANPSIASKSSDKDVKKASPAGKPNTIRIDGIGMAKIGMTFGELKKSLDKNITLEVTDNFAVDFSAIAVKKQGKVQFYIPYERKSKLGDEDPIHYLVTDNPTYKTEQGVSPGMTIKQAAQIYGPAKLIFSRDNESKEIVRFAQQPADLTFYGVRSGDQNLAGIYPESNDAVLETDRYSDQAQIGKIIVACRPEVCGGEH